jgi:hypothetical protein
LRDPALAVAESNTTFHLSGTIIPQREKLP